jgi:hypothetical protein
VVRLWLRRAAAQADKAVAQAVYGPRWKAKALFLVVAICLFRAFPGYRFLQDPSVLRTWSDAQIKVDHPLADMVRLFRPKLTRRN